MHPSKKPSKTPSLSSKLASPTTYLSIFKPQAKPKQSNLSMNLSPNVRGKVKGGGVKEFYLMAGVKKKEEGKNEWNKENSKDCYSPNSGGAFAQRALDKSSKSFRKTGNDSNILETKEDELHEFRANEIIKMPTNNRTPEHHCMGTKFSTMGSTQVSPKLLSSISSPTTIERPHRFLVNNNSITNSTLQKQVMKQSKGLKSSDDDFVEMSRETDEDNSFHKIEVFCQKHTTRKVEYFIIESAASLNVQQVVFICSKCAVEHATQGKVVLEIQSKLKEQLQNNPDLLLPNEYNALFSIEQEKKKPETIIENLSEGEDFSEDCQVREREIEEFLKILKKAKNDSQSSLSSLTSRKKDVIFFYDKQIIKLDQIHNFLQKIIERERNMSTAKLKHFMSQTTNSFNEKINSLESFLKDIDFIESDIEQNLPKIVKEMEDKHFFSILEKYKEETSNCETFIDGLYKEKLLLEKMTNSSIKIYQKKIEDVLSPELSRLFSTFEVNSSYLKKDCSIESESPMPNEKSFPKYNVFPPTAGIPNENNSIYISFENKEIFMENLKNSNLENLSRITENQSKIETSNLFAGNNDTFHFSGKDSKDNTLRTPKTCDKTKEFNSASAQPGKLLNVLNEDSKCKSKSNDKQSNSKFKTLLEKVNESQNNTKNFLLGNCGFVSPPMQKSKSDEKITIFQSLKSEKKQGNIIQPAGQPNNQNNKEIKNYEVFLNFIENQLNDNSEKNAGMLGCQKTLFAPSPHFKDV